MRVLVALPVLACAAALAACGGGTDDEASSAADAGHARRIDAQSTTSAASGTTGTPADLCTPGLHALPAAGGGLLHVGAGTGRRPLLLAFHGAGGEAHGTRAYYDLERASDRDGALVAYPQAVSDRFWQLRPDQPADVQQIRELLTALTALPCVDPARVTATGVSNGGGFAARVGCDLADLVAGVAPVAGGYRSLGLCRPSRPVSVLEVHGLADPVVPYGGKPPDRKGAVRRFLTGWVARDGCGTRAARSTPCRGVTRLRYRGCDGAVRVAHLRLAGTDHGWPGGDWRAAGFGRAVPGRDPTGLDTTREVWRFLRAARTPGR